MSWRRNEHAVIHPCHTTVVPTTVEAAANRNTLYVTAYTGLVDRRCKHTGNKNDCSGEGQH
jgi:hypothetical protein